MKQILIALPFFLLIINLIADEDYMTNALGDVPGSSDYKTENSLKQSNYLTKARQSPEPKNNTINTPPTQQYNQSQQQQNRYRLQNTKGPFKKVNIYDDNQASKYGTSVKQQQNTCSRVPTQDAGSSTHIPQSINKNQINQRDPNYMHYSTEQLAEKAKADEMEKGILNKLDRQ